MPSLRHIINIASLSLLLCSCCKDQYGQGSLQPEWSIKIPSFESAEIFYDGLPNLPKSGDIIIAHTTISDNGFWQEDNRLCAIDVNTRDVVWYFPNNLEEHHLCAFDSKGYVYQDKLVFQYLRDGTERNADAWHTTVCLDINTGKLLWEIDDNDPSDANNKDIVGDGLTCFFIHNGNSVKKVNLISGEVFDFYSSDTLRINRMSLSEGNVALSCSIRTPREFMYNDYTIVLNQEDGEEVLPLTFITESTIVPHSFYSNGVVYANAETYLVAIDIKTRTIIWERDDYWAYSLNDLYVYKNVLLKCAENSTVGYDKDSGKILYDYRDYGSWYSSFHGKYVYLINRKEILDIIDIETGEIVDYVICPNKGEGFFGSYPMIYDDKLYVMGNNSLYRYPTYPWN